MSNQDPQPPPVNPPPGFSQPPKPVPPQQGGGQSSPTFVDSFIPSKNGPALVAYYLGLFSIFPLFGLILGAMAVNFGRKGLAATKLTPGLAGATHAKVGIGCGAIGFLFNLALVLLFGALLLFGKK
jgi:hypothetical protein